jgi:diguanylate cyclase (GGDEF)-like protein
MGTARQSQHQQQASRNSLLLRPFPVWEGHIRFGIVARLALIFLCVGGLVLATRFIVDRSVLVVRRTNTIRTVQAPPMMSPIVIPRAVVAAAAPKLVSPDALLLALNRFDGAVQRRMRDNNAATDAAVQQSITALDRVRSEYFNGNAALSGKVRESSASALQEHLQLGQALIEGADARHVMLKQYLTLLNGLKLRDKSSLDKAWKIFGRVVTRQSLLQLDADLDTMIRDSAGLDLTDEQVTVAIAALPDAEASVQRDLDGNKNALVRSEGTSWYAGMQADFLALLAERQKITEANQEMGVRGGRFSRQTDELTALLTDKSLARARPQPPADTVNKDASAQHQTFPLVSAPAISPATLVETTESTSPLEQPQSGRDYLLWFCALLVALLTYVAVGTALSIIRPVRRLVQATASLARGDSAVRMPRGGLKELDTVAVAFNQMAEEISAARQGTLDYQRSLEQQVDERTRELQHLARQDPLTSLPNRREMFVLLNDALTNADAQDVRVAVFFIDVDNFKYINDSMGHGFGDRVLIALAQRLQDASRAVGFCARLGGDEFTVVVTGAQSVEAIREAGMGIVEAFQEPLTIDARALIVSVSVGASIYPDHERHAEGLLKAADAALFRAKTMGRGQLSLYTPELLEAAIGKFAVEQGLRRGIERGEFELLFQPEINAGALNTTLVEALLRWRAPDGRLIPPGEFLPIAEETGLIMEIGDWVLQSAIETAAHWHHGVWPEVCVAVNVSPLQLMDASFVDRVSSLLRQYRLPAHCIEIELTESVLQTGPATIDALKRLRANGVAIALDDFGTGYSSLASLEQLPLTRIKLDRSLVSRIDRSSRAAAIANAIIVMCQGLGLKITAEGVERPAQFSLLAAYRGMYLQGYLIAPPTARDGLIPLLNIALQRARELVLESPANNLHRERKTVKADYS